jgi:hypothetical protein
MSKPQARPREHDLPAGALVVNRLEIRRLTCSSEFPKNFSFNAPFRDPTASVTVSQGMINKAASTASLADIAPE